MPDTRPSERSLTEPGSHVRYVPGHAHGDSRHPDCADGIIVMHRAAVTFVQFADGGPKACTPSDLVPLQPREMIDEIPRRSRLDLHTPAELAIRTAVEEVEAAGAHKLLTDAVNLLHEAREKVADFVEAPGLHAAAGDVNGGRARRRDVGDVRVERVDLNGQGQPVAAADRVQETASGCVGRRDEGGDVGVANLKENKLGRGGPAVQEFKGEAPAQG